MIPVKSGDVSRDSTEYAEIVAEVFVETVQKSAGKVMCCEHDSEEITPSLMECLQYVYLHGMSPVREIACGLEISLSGASQLVDRLVKKGLVTRRDSETDRRMIEVELTGSGRDVVGQMRKLKSEWFESILGAMGEDERNAFRNGLESFLRVALSSDDNIDRACVRCGREHVQFCVVSQVMADKAAQTQ